MAAITHARSIVGFKYDIFFDFNSAEERKLIEADPERAKAGAVKFCCTEIPHYCFLEHLPSLDLYRTRRTSLLQSFLALLGLRVAGDIVTADMYVEANFKVVWVSKFVTPKWLAQMGCSEKLLSRIETFCMGSRGLRS